MTRNIEVANYNDIVDVRDIIERFEYLDGQRDDAGKPIDEDEGAEWEVLRTLLDELTGYGGDHQWQGAWFPVTLIRDSYFEDYARDLAEDIGAIDRKSQWPYTCIDWEAAAHELQQDYSSVEWDGVTYWYR